MDSKKIRGLINWVVPKNLEGLLGLVWDAVANSRITANKALKNRHVGKRCFVIGNGPSLGKTDLALLAGEFTIGANSFYRHPQAGVVGLKYLCIGDPHFMVERPETVTWHNTLCDKMPQTTFILHHTGQPLVQKNGLYRNRDVFFVRGGLTTTTESFARIDFTRSLNVGRTTGTMVAIPLAMYMGFSEIYLVGFDANWLDNYDGSYHFYDQHELFPEFDSVAADNRGFNYEDELASVLREYQSHSLLQQIAKARGIKLANATLGGRLDMHPRLEYRSLFNA
jgi:hypothetical protein